MTHSYDNTIRKIPDVKLGCILNTEDKGNIGFAWNLVSDELKTYRDTQC
jgi:hypothetical protein